MYILCICTITCICCVYAMYMNNIIKARMGNHEGSRVTLVFDIHGTYMEHIRNIHYISCLSVKHVLCVELSCSLVMSCYDTLFNTMQCCCLLCRSVQCYTMVWDSQRCYSCCDVICYIPLCHALLGF